MTNRERYITKRNEYDIMTTISKTVCPIWVITGKEPKEWDICPHKGKDTCAQCIQNWLNKESEE